MASAGYWKGTELLWCSSLAMPLPEPSQPPPHPCPNPLRPLHQWLIVSWLHSWHCSLIGIDYAYPKPTLYQHSCETGSTYFPSILCSCLSPDSPLIFPHQPILIFLLTISVPSFPFFLHFLPSWHIPWYFSPPLMFFAKLLSLLSEFPFITHVATVLFHIANHCAPALLASCSVFPIWCCN